MVSRALRAVTACALALALLSACGDDDDTGSAAPEREADDTSADPADPADTATAAPAADAPDVAEPERTDAPDVELSEGGCRATVEGDVTTSWEAADDTFAFGYGPWLEEQAASVLSIGAADAAYFILNCSAGANSISFLSSNDTPVPQEPATYTLHAQDDSLDGQAEDDPIGVLVTFEDSDTNWGLESDSTFTITEFTDDHIAGTFELHVTDVLYELADRPSEGSARVAGEFLFTREH